MMLVGSSKSDTGFASTCKGRIERLYGSPLSGTTFPY